MEILSFGFRQIARNGKMRFFAFGQSAEMRKCVFLLLGRVPNRDFGDFWLWAGCRSRYNPNLAFGQRAEVGKVQNSPFGTFAESKKCQNLKTAFLPMHSFFLRLCSSRLPKQEKCTAGDSASQNLLQEGKNERQGKKKRTDTEKMRTRCFLPLLPSLNVIVIRFGFRALLNFGVPNALAKPPQRISARV